MLITDIIDKKRRNKSLSVKEISRFVQGIGDFSVSDGEIAAFAMAATINGLNVDETTNLATEMIKSGIIIDWGDISGGLKVTDVYSTLSVGNKMNIIIPPILAALGAIVPKVGESSGVNYSGYGTLDKIVGIRGYNPSTSLDYLKKVICKTRCAIISPSEELVPVERRFYPIRCMTAANTNPGFTAAAMLSRSLCSGIESLTVNINVGNGSLYRTAAEAEQVISYIKTVAGNFKLPLTIVTCNSDYIFGKNVGNSLELKEIIDYFKSSPENRNSVIHDRVLAIAGQSLILNGLATDPEDARLKIESILISGLALDILAAMTESFGGPADFVDYPDAYLHTSLYAKPVAAPRAGYISAVDSYTIGQIARQLMENEGHFDYGAGLEGIVSVGDKIESGEPLCVIHGSTPSVVEKCEHEFLAAVTITDAPPKIEKLILDIQ